MHTKVKLGSMDAAMVFRRDGEIEVILPNLADEVEVPDNVAVAHALFQAWSDKQMRESIIEAAEKRLDELDEMEGPAP